MIGKKGFCWWVMGAALAIQCVFASQAFSERYTNDWQADLITVLISKGMEETAERICTARIESQNSESDQAAQWAIRLSSVRAARMLGSVSLLPEQIDRAKRPLNHLLDAAPDHPRRWWLDTECAMVDLASARHAAVNFAIASHRTNLQVLGIQRVGLAIGQFRELDQKLKDAISLSASGRRQNGNTSTDLLALRQNVGKQWVAALLVRSRLFPLHSPNAIASATEAETHSERLLQQMHMLDRGRWKIELLRAEAAYRSNSLRQAKKILTLIRDRHNLSPPQVLAWSIRVGLAAGDKSVDKKLSQYYGNSPAQATLSPEMDLARLAWLLSLAQSRPKGQQRDAALRRVADWLEIIERRNGPYYRRIAEAETLRQMRIGADSADVRLLAAEAGKKLREGDLRAAADLLAQAALADSDPGTALRYASQAAAAYVGSELSTQASTLLARVSQKHAAHPAASKTHLQTAYLLAKSIQQEESTDYSSLHVLLKENLQRWPNSPSAPTARAWLLRLLEVNKDYLQGAQLAIAARPMNASGVVSAGRLWCMALRQASDPLQAERRTTEALQQWKQLIQDVPQVSSAAADQRLRIAALYGTPKQLAEAYGLDSDDPFATKPWLKAFTQVRMKRRTGNREDFLPLVQEDTPFVADAIDRLFADGRLRPGDRRRLGLAILGLLETWKAGAFESNERLQDPLVHAEALCWAGRWNEAVAVSAPIFDLPQGRSERLARVAVMLGECNAKGAQRQAIEYWNRLARGVPQGSTLWHRAKMSTAERLKQLGDVQKSKRLCQYVLMTHPPKDLTIRARYQAMIDQKDPAR